MAILVGLDLLGVRNTWIHRPNLRCHRQHLDHRQDNVERQHIVNPTVEGPLPVQSAHRERILRSLPEWFVIESSIVQYVKDVEYMPTLLCHHDGNVVGFMTIRRHNLYSAEIHVVGVLPTHHRQGIGKALLNRAEEWLVSEGFQFLQVKMLGPSRPDENYDKTRLFYESVGFRSLEEFPTLWGETLPCLLMVKKLTP